MARMLPDGVSMSKPTHIAFTDLGGFDVILEVDSITEVSRLPAIEARPNLRLRAHPEQTAIAVRGGSRYATLLPVSAFEAAINPVRVAETVPA